MKLIYGIHFCGFIFFHVENVTYEPLSLIA